MAAQNYRDLVAWQRSMDLVEMVYAVTRAWPKDEQYGLASQIRRAVVSVSANIAEGQGRGGAKEFMHLLTIAHGSPREVETHILIAQRLQYIDEPTCERLLQQAGDVGRPLQGLIRSLRPPPTSR